MTKYADKLNLFLFYLLQYETFPEKDYATFLFFFSKPLFTQKEKLNLKTYNSTPLDIYIERENLSRGKT